jgi:transcriptional regulator with XRE-family HTH domain
MSGADVQAWREKRRLSQSDLARELPVSVRTLQGWEAERGTGKLPPFLRRALNDLDREIKERKRGKK